MSQDWSEARVNRGAQVEMIRNVYRRYIELGCQRHQVVDVS